MCKFTFKKMLQVNVLIYKYKMIKCDFHCKQSKQQSVRQTVTRQNTKLTLQEWKSYFKHLNFVINILIFSFFK